MSAVARKNPICNAFSVDVEDYFHVSAYSRVIARRDWDSFPSRVEANTRAMMEVLAEADVKGTFFVLGWVAERYPGLVSEIAAQGHEIACHGYSHKLIYRQSKKQFTEEAHRAKSLLEDICGTAVNGYRGASFSITRESLWALDALAELGFTFDSSIYPVRHDRYGIPGAPTRPFTFRCQSGATINEFPMTTVDILGWRMPVSGGGYFRIYPYALSRAALRHLNLRKSEPFVFYTHPWEIDPAQPFINASWLS
ncbi:MAG: DUF3473 domain-containing protein, partial [Gammaproteobacteria bacterium]|nr:DUF3473 domain-containing protein [Gammaproteobacteria bacterium]